MPHKQRPPKYSHTFIDSCAFNPGGGEEAASRRIMEKWPFIIVAHSVQKELNHPNTPEDIKRLGNSFVYTIETELPPELIKKKLEIRALIQGNAQEARHKGDADHLFELYKHGGGYFITTDSRLLDFSETLFESYFITTIKPTDYEALL